LDLSFLWIERGNQGAIYTPDDMTHQMTASDLADTKAATPYSCRLSENVSVARFLAEAQVGVMLVSVADVGDDPMTRREFIAGLSGAAAWPLAAEAQTPVRTVRVGAMSLNPRTAPFWIAFEQHLRDLGYREGRNLTFDFVEASGIPDVGEAMHELVRRKADILVAGGPEIVLQSAIRAADTLPIVMIAIDYDPIALGYVDSLARPKGNVTGVYFQQIELALKRAELMREAFPDVGRATVFWDRLSSDQWQAVEAKQERFGIRLVGIELRDPPYDYEAAIERAPPDFREALLVMTSPILFRDRQRLARFALSRRLPTMFAFREWIDAGGLLSYGPSITALYRLAAEYVDRIARGAKPADLPIEQPTKFELVVNLKTAKAIGLTIPTPILLRADEVIE
jgi:putative tryptophan/tyrosine transport system substrate-binding protein